MKRGREEVDFRVTDAIMWLGGFSLSNYRYLLSKYQNRKSQSKKKKRHKCDYRGACLKQLRYYSAPMINEAFPEI